MKATLSTIWRLLELEALGMGFNGEYGELLMLEADLGLEALLWLAMGTILGTKGS